MPILESIKGITPASLLGLFVVLPVSLVLFYYLPQRLRTMVLSLCSIGFVLLVQWKWIPLLLVSVLITYTCCFFMAKWNEQIIVRPILYGVAIMVNVLIFIVAASLVQLTLGPFILGGAFYPVVGIMLAGDYFRNPERKSQKFWDFALNMLFFPQLFMGPFSLLEPEDYESLYHARLSGTRLAQGGSLFLRGAFQAGILGKGLWLLQEQLLTALPDKSLLAAWSTLLVFAMAWYLILLGFSEMAQGAAVLFGFSLPASFANPFGAKSINQLYASFHITWKNFVHQEVLLPLERERSGVVWSSAHTIVAGMLVGIWYGFTFNYVLWGGLLALFIVLERYVLNDVLRRTPALVGRGYTLLVLFLSFPILIGQELGESLGLYRLLFSWGGRVPFVNGATLYMLSSHWLLLLLAVFACTTLPGRIATAIKAKNKGLYTVGSVALYSGLLVMLTILLV